MNFFPRSVNTYSTFGGTTGYGILFMNPNRCNLSNRWFITFLDKPEIDRLSSPGLRLPDEMPFKTATDHLQPIIFSTILDDSLFSIICYQKVPTEPKGADLPSPLNKDKKESSLQRRNGL